LGIRWEGAPVFLRPFGDERVRNIQKQGVSVASSAGKLIRTLSAVSFYDFARQKEFFPGAGEVRRHCHESNGSSRAVNLPELAIGSVRHANAVVACRFSLEIQTFCTGRIMDASSRSSVQPNRGGAARHVEIERPSAIGLDWLIDARFETDPLIEWPFDTCQVSAVRNIDSIETGFGDPQRNRSWLAVWRDAPVAGCQRFAVAGCALAAPLP